MKKQLLTVLVLIIEISTASAQITIDSAFRMFNHDNNKIVFEKIIESELEKPEMFVNAKKWIALNYKDYKSVMNLEDEQNGIIIYKGISAIFDGHMSHRFSYTTEITIKDKKARLRLYDIFNLTYSGYPTPIETTLGVIIDRNKNKPKANGEFVYQQYDLFTKLLLEISKAIITKDTF